MSIFLPTFLSLIVRVALRPIPADWELTKTGVMDRKDGAGVGAAIGVAINVDAGVAISSPVGIGVGVGLATDVGVGV